MQVYVEKWPLKLCVYVLMKKKILVLKTMATAPASAASNITGRVVPVLPVILQY